VLGELQQCQNSWKSEFVEAQYKDQPSLNTLRDRGCLAVMDSTHKTVRLFLLFLSATKSVTGSPRHSSLRKSKTPRSLNLACVA
jgi:hypothetical protein